MKAAELKELIALNTLVFETLGKPEKERSFSFGTLKRWGLDLLKGKKQGIETYFTSETGKHTRGEAFDENGEHYEVSEILNKMPAKKKVVSKSYLLIN